MICQVRFEMIIFFNYYNSVLLTQGAPFVPVLLPVGPSFIFIQLFLGIHQSNTRMLRGTNVVHGCKHWARTEPVTSPISVKSLLGFVLGLGLTLGLGSGLTLGLGSGLMFGLGLRLEFNRVKVKARVWVRVRVRIRIKVWVRVRVNYSEHGRKDIQKINL